MGTFIHTAQEKPQPPALTTEELAEKSKIVCPFCGVAPCWWLTSEGQSWKPDPLKAEDRPHPRELAPDMLIGLETKDGVTTAKTKSEPKE